MSAIIRTFDAVVDSVNKDDMSIVARINTSNIDRYNTVIAAKGGKFKNWRAAGYPVLWEHGKDVRRFTDPIANSKGVWNNGGPAPTEILAEPRFLKDDFARQRFEWYRDGIIKGWSVNILPTDNSASPPTQEELRSRPDWEGASMIYRDWDLAELSGTVIPGNAEALTSDRASKLLELVQRGLVSLPDDVKELVEARARTMTDTTTGMAVKPVERKIVEEDGKWCVYSEDGKKRLGGPYASKAEAEKRLAEVEHFKHEDERGYSIAQEGDEWVIRDAEWVLILSSDDEVIARRSFDAMQVSRTWDDLHGPMIEAQARRNSEITKFLADELNLRLKGTV